MPGKYVGRAAVKMFAPDKNGIKTGSFLFGNSKAARPQFFGGPVGFDGTGGPQS